MTFGSESWLRWPVYEQINIHLLPLNDFTSHLPLILDLENNLSKHETYSKPKWHNHVNKPKCNRIFVTKTPDINIDGFSEDSDNDQD